MKRAGQLSITWVLVVGLTAVMATTSCSYDWARPDGEAERDSGPDGEAERDSDPDVAADSAIDAETAPDGDRCVCRDGPCCDGCQFLGPETRCDDEPISMEYRCAAEGCGADPQRRGLFRHCSGVSDECPDAVLRQGDWAPIQDCSLDQICVFNGELPGCHSCLEDCAEGQCTEPQCSSGPCCLGERFAPPTTRCEETVVATECRCTSEACGADIECRDQYPYCTGTSADCSADHLVWEGWIPDQECTSDQICQLVGTSCIGQSVT